MAFGEGPAAAGGGRRLVIRGPQIAIEVVEAETEQVFAKPLDEHRLGDLDDDYPRLREPKTQLLGAQPGQRVHGLLTTCGHPGRGHLRVSLGQARIAHRYAVAATRRSFGSWAASAPTASSAASAAAIAADSYMTSSFGLFANQTSA